MNASKADLETGQEADREEHVVRYRSGKPMKATTDDLIQSCKLKIHMTYTTDDSHYLLLKCADRGFFDWLQQFAEAQLDHPELLYNYNSHMINDVWVHRIPKEAIGEDVLLFKHDDQEISMEHLKKGQVVECLTAWEDDEWHLVQLLVHKSKPRKSKIIATEKKSVMQ